MKTLSSHHLIFLLSVCFCVSLVDSFSDSLLARLESRLQNLVGGEEAASTVGSVESSSGPVSHSLIDRIIEHLHGESELAFDNVVSEASERSDLLKVEADLAACYDDAVGEVRMSLFHRSLGEVVRHFLKLHSDVLENGLIPTILRRIRALVANIRFVARETIKCLIAKAEGVEPTKIGLTPLAAYTHDEFVSMFLNPVLGQNSGNASSRLFKRSTQNNCSVHVNPSDLPETWDWRTVRAPGKEYSVVTPVRSQGPCSSCFVFASIAAMESVYMMSAENVHNRQQSSFSEQALLNCVSGGCGGGFPKDVYRLAMVDGLVPAHYYPYRHNVGKCDHSHSPLGPPVSRPVDYCEHYAMESDADLQSLVYQYGPVVSAIYTNDSLFPFLRGPWNRNCASEAVDHAVLTVGYTPTEWIIKNSWGKKWGVDGYLVMPRDNTNRCGIYYQASAVSFAGGLVHNQPQANDQNDQNDQNEQNEEPQPEVQQEEVVENANKGGYFYNLFYGK